MPDRRKHASVSTIIHDQTRFLFRNLLSKFNGEMMLRQLYPPEKSLKVYPLIARTNTALLRVKITDNARLYTIHQNS